MAVDFYDTTARVFFIPQPPVSKPVGKKVFVEPIRCPLIYASRPCPICAQMGMVPSQVSASFYCHERDSLTGRASKKDLFEARTLEERWTGQLRKTSSSHMSNDPIL